MPVNGARLEPRQRDSTSFPTAFDSRLIRDTCSPDEAEAKSGNRDADEAPRIALRSIRATSDELSQSLRGTTQKKSSRHTYEVCRDEWGCS